MRRFVWAAALLLWVGAIASATVVLMRYESTPGLSGATPAAWPANSPISAPATRCSLVLAVHPRCPCTQATLTELQTFLANAPKPIEVHVLCCVPPGVSEEWNESSICLRAKEIVATAAPGSDCLQDVGGRAATLFGMTTSGHVALYAPAGRLLFSGGITGSRGQVGENGGLLSLLAATGGSKWSERKRSDFPVFGCELVRAHGCPLCGGAR